MVHQLGGKWFLLYGGNVRREEKLQCFFHMYREVEEGDVLRTLAIEQSFSSALKVLMQFCK